MRLPRYGIASMMALIVIVVLNIGAYRACYYTFWTNDAAWSNQLDVLFLGAVPMANVLVVGLILALWRRGRRPFLLGFLAFGIVAWMGYVALVALYPHDVVRPYLFRFHRPVIDAIVQGRTGPLPNWLKYAILGFAATLILGWWQLTLALIGGFCSWSLWGARTPRERHFPAS